jgi:hypothetical protein
LNNSKEIKKKDEEEEFKFITQTFSKFEKRIRKQANYKHKKEKVLELTIGKRK